LLNHPSDVKLECVASSSYHHGDLVNALLNAADARLAKQGLAGLSLRQVAADVGVAPSAAYHHFADRDALVDALAVRALDRLALAVERRISRVPKADALGRLVALGRAYVTWARDEPAHFEIAFGPGRASPNVTSNRRPYGLLEDLLEDAIAQNLLPAAARPHAALVVWPAIHGLAALAAIGPLRKSSEREILRRTDELTLTVLAGLRARAGDASRRVSDGRSP
jgi:AcrR family transcriptional regulator